MKLEYLGPRGGLIAVEKREIRKTIRWGAGCAQVFSHPCIPYMPYFLHVYHADYHPDMLETPRRKNLG